MINKNNLIIEQKKLKNKKIAFHKNVTKMRRKKIKLKY